MADLFFDVYEMAVDTTFICFRECQTLGTQSIYRVCFQLKTANRTTAVWNDRTSCPRDFSKSSATKTKSRSTQNDLVLQAVFLQSISALDTLSRVALSLVNLLLFTVYQSVPWYFSRTRVEDRIKNLDVVIKIRFNPHPFPPVNSFFSCPLSYHSCPTTILVKSWIFVDW